MSGGILFQGGPFRFATFIPDVTVSAVGQDALAITGFPAESGVTMADHSFKLPVRLEMIAAWSDSTAGIEGYIQQVYQRLLQLQATRLPFSLFTSRRMYKNMLMESLTDPIDAGTLSAMIPRITFRELIISRTKTASATTAQPASDPANQANPESTGSVTDRGTVQTQDTTAQNFAGAYNPGSGTPVGPGAYNLDGTSATGQGFGLNPPGLGAGLNPTPIDNGLVGSVLNPPPTIVGGVPDLPVGLSPNLTGISPPTVITLPEFSAPQIGGLQGAGPDQYNMFGGGP